MQTFPNVIARMVDAGGRIIQPLLGYLQQFTIAPPPFITLDVPLVSPFEYEAVEPGFIHIDGAITSVSLTRGTDTLDLTGNTLIPVAVKDTVNIVYVVDPIVTFIPSYGQSTTS